MAFKTRALTILNIASVTIACFFIFIFVGLCKAERSNHEDTISQLDSAKQVISDLKTPEYKFVFLGDFKLTHYCSELYPHICGEGHGITYTGTKATPGRTIAVDPKKIPYGTQVYIEGYGWRIAEDKGAWVNDNHIDILVDTHDRALELGTKIGGVWILVKNS
jgi:3D (Asp-Asp-Asp) domain-containing protein